MQFLITRPQAQAKGLVDLLEAQQHTVQVMPVIKINQIDDTAPTIKLIRDLKNFDIAIFISANAVHQSAILIKKYAPSILLNECLKIGVIGPSTAQAIKEEGWNTDIMAAGQYDSEGLLQVQALQSVAGQKIIIFRGEGGREVLYDNLIQRGANVSQAVTYKRSLPLISDTALKKIFNLQEDGQMIKLDGVVVMSNESLYNLYTLASNQYREILLASQLVVISKRCADLAQDLKFKKPAIIADTSDESSIFKALVENEK